MAICNEVGQFCWLAAEAIYEVGCDGLHRIMAPVWQGLKHLDTGLTADLTLVERITLVATGILLLVPIINQLVYEVWREVAYLREEPLIEETLEPNEMPFESAPVTEEAIPVDDGFFSIEAVAPQSPEECARRKEAFLAHLAEWNTAGERYQRAGGWQCSHQVIDLHVYRNLSHYREDHPLHKLSRFKSILPDRQRRWLSDLLREECRYHGNETSKQSISKLYDFLNQRWTEYRGTSREEPFKRYLASILQQVIDAHQNCSAQINAQLESLLINVIVRWESSQAGEVSAETVLRNRVSYELFRYLLNTIQKACAVEYHGEVHIERAIRRRVATNLGITETSIVVGDPWPVNQGYVDRIWDIVFAGKDSFDNEIVSDQRKEQRRHCHHNPVKYLIEQLRVPHGDMQVLRNEILLWMRKYYDLEADDQQTQDFVAQISADPAFTADEGGDLTYGAVLYFLCQLGFIEENI